MSKVLLSGLFLLNSLLIFGQNTDEVFGKNRIQYREFDWKYITSENFEVYYYDEGVTYAREATAFLENNFDRITDLMGYPPYNRTKIFLYNSITELQQSNVGINYHGPSSGGEAQFIKANIEIAHTGTLEGFKEELLYKVTKLLLNEMLYGGTLKEMLQNTFMNLPEWLVEGAALYISKGWSMEMDDFVRGYIRESNNIRLTKLSGKKAGLIGQSIWNYISERHGKSNISSILNYIKIIRNEEKSIAITLGIPFREIMIDWRRFYIEMDIKLDENYNQLPEFASFTKKNRKSLVYKNISFSPDGMKIAFSENDMGKYTVRIYDMSTDEDYTVITGGSRVVNQDVNYNIPLMSWIDDNTLGVIDTQKGKIIFWIYDIISESKIPRELKNITEVNSLSFNQNGRLGILSATVNGKSDLYLMSTRRERIKRLTNDYFDDIHASFVPNSNTVIFSSNRTTDTLKTSGIDIDNINSNFNLYFYSLDTTDLVVTKLTNTVSRDTEPVALSANEIMYLSDQRGINNLFIYEVNSNLYKQISNYKASLKEFHYNEATKSLVFIASYDSEDQIYLIKGFDKAVQTFTPPSQRKQTLQLKTVVKRRAEQQNEAQMSVKDLIDKRLSDLEEETDSLTTDTLAINPIDSTAIAEENKENALDTENYVFERQVQTQRPEQEQSFLQQYRQVKKEETISRPNDFESLFSYNKFVTTALIDPIRGLGMTVQTDMTDLLENHHFSGGLMITTDLRSGDVWTEYKYLKSLIDYSVRFDRKVLYWTKESDLPPTIDKYSLNKIQLSASYPLNVKSRVTLRPFYQQNVYNDLGKLDQSGFPSPFPEYINTENTNYAGADVEFVFDNSIISGLNLRDGTKAKVRFSHYQSIGNIEETFSNIRAEIRHYQKIHREIHFATRFFYGAYFGKGAQNYLLGSIDNNIVNRIDTSNPKNPLSPTIQGNRSDLLFVEFVTPMRGFDFSTLYGTDVMAMNFELRVPLIKYLNSGYIPSNFFRNIQFNAFFDMGSAWTGKSPFNPENTISTVTLPPEGAFEITLNNFKNPWLMSYGFGFRTMIFGYYAKFDVAWPIIDYAPDDPVLSVSVGFDF